MVICDPCCGHNAILNVFEKHGFQVVGDDLHTHPDKRIFPPIPFHIIVTNPIDIVLGTFIFGK